VTSGFAPLTLPGALAPRTRTRRKVDLRIAGSVLAAVLLVEAALLFFPHVLVLHAAQASVWFKQLSGYAMVGLLVLAMGFGALRRHAGLATRQRLLNDIHQFGGLVLLLLLALHAAGRPGGFLHGLFHALATAQGAGALRALLGTRLGRKASILLLVLHIALSCLACAAVLLHLYFVYAYTA
jgi:hypothetical protein